jgi:carbon monoxide dehydrogenase subunit G
MKLDGEFVFDAAVQDVWDALFDPQVLAAVLPGCEKLELVDGAYVGDIKVKIGPIQGKFTGKVDLLDKVEPTSYRMVIDGRGPQGFVNATATIELAAAGEGTQIRYTSEAQIGGKIASVGQRLVETSAKAIVKQSLEGLDGNIKLRVAAHKAHAEKVAAETLATPEPPAAPAPVVATPETPAEPSTPVAPPAGEPVAMPVVEYKKADVGKLGAAVAKEVTKSLAPYLLLVAIGIALVIYLVTRQRYSMPYFSSL